MTEQVLQDLAAIILQRMDSDPETSYVARLCNAGLNATLKKIGEESAELIIAANSEDKDAIIHEAADLWFHTLVMLAQKGLGPEDILAELERRSGQSGIEEKAGRDRTA